MNGPKNLASMEKILSLVADDGFKSKILRRAANMHGQHAFTAVVIMCVWPILGPSLGA